MMLGRVNVPLQEHPTLHAPSQPVFSLLCNLFQTMFATTPHPGDAPLAKVVLGPKISAGTSDLPAANKSPQGIKRRRRGGDS